MVKATLIYAITILSLYGDSKVAPPELERECLQCHTAQKIPSEAIYRRYKSVMPPQFFNKFSLTGRSELDDAALHQRVDEYIDYFDVVPRLYILPEQ